MPRGSRPGERRGGRSKGTPNKRSVEIAELLEELRCDPIEGMARIAMNKRAAPELRGRMYSELAQYLYPKRKAIERSGQDGTPLVPEENNILDAARRIAFTLAQGAAAVNKERAKSK